MKSSNTVVSVIVIAAVLVFSYAVGLLIRHARTGGQAAPPPSATTEAPPGAELSSGPGEVRTKDTSQERARARELKAKAIEQMNSLTEEQKQKILQSQVRKQVGGRSGTTGLESLASPARQVQETKTPASSQTDRSSEDVNSLAPQTKSK